MVKTKKVTRTIKICLRPGKDAIELFEELSVRFMLACGHVSQYIFDNGFPLVYAKVNAVVYRELREMGLKSQMAQSVSRLVIARYKTVKTQMEKQQYICKDDETGKTYVFQKTLEWMWQPIYFARPQVDLVRGKDYSFCGNAGRWGVGALLSINTLEGRMKVAYDMPECFDRYFDGTWKLGTGKLVCRDGLWYLHVSATKKIPDTFDRENPLHVTGIDRGIRFLETCYDETGKTTFHSGKEAGEKRQRYRDTRARLKSKGTKSAKRVLKRISGRENRWMTDVNHVSSKTLAAKYGPGTLHTLENLSGVSFAKDTLSERDADGRYALRSWPFYQYGQFLAYKAEDIGSEAVEVNAAYTSQRCPHCGRIRKENRDHRKHEYVCDWCGFRTNDDRVGSMNIHVLGLRYSHGEEAPRFTKEVPVLKSVFEPAQAAKDSPPD